MYKMKLKIHKKEKGTQTQYVCACGQITLFPDLCSECQDELHETKGDDQ